MSKPGLSGSPNSFFVSPAQVLVGPNLNSLVDVGFVSGVSIKVKHETTEVKTDQLGKTVANHFYVGDTISVEIMMDELTAQRLATAYPFADLVGTYPNEKITWGQPVGGNFYSIAQMLVVRPTVDDTTNKLRNFTFYKAIPIGDSDIKYSPDGKTQIKATFHCYPDVTQPNGQWFGYFGDAAAGTLVPASAASPTYGGGNVGNGVMGSFALNDSFTKSETWTATCLKIGPAAIFAVVGSVTGARGNATSASTYFSNSAVPTNSEIEFLITDGGTAWAIGDTISVVTTAANYT